jgi:FkbM family methyltransferase
MKKFSFAEGIIRRNFYLYIFVRKLAPFICKYIPLEDGFNFLKYIKPNDPKFVALDIGANDGTSIRMIHKYHPSSVIEAFDPVTKPNFKLNKVNFHDLGMSNTDGELEIFTPIVKGRIFSQYSSIYKDKIINQITFDMKIARAKVSLYSKIIKLKTTDSFNFEPYFIKIDVEGAELMVLKGAEETIKSFAPIILIEIQNNSIFIEIENCLNDFDYFCVQPGNFLSDNRSLNMNKYGFIPATNNYVWAPRSSSYSWSIK